jgi:hypothetical protein
MANRVVVRPASLCSLACRYDKPMPESTLWGDKVESGSRRLAGRYDNPVPKSTISLHTRTKNLAADSLCWLTGITYVQCTLGIWVLHTVHTYVAMTRVTAYVLFKFRCAFSNVRAAGGDSGFARISQLSRPLSGKAVRSVREGGTVSPTQ